MAQWDLLLREPSVVVAELAQPCLIDSESFAESDEVALHGAAIGELGGGDLDDLHEPAVAELLADRAITPARGLVAVEPLAEAVEVDADTSWGSSGSGKRNRAW
ncbi:hypothetical protein [Nannocystis pusilla]|uniref:hypothetical protein n=1 Tax=Nannocystis pusilla TaxID=889268 RepID=UPI003B7D08DD